MRYPAELHSSVGGPVGSRGRKEKRDGRWKVTAETKINGWPERKWREKRMNEETGRKNNGEK